MCGITGIIALNKEGLSALSNLDKALDTLTQRGPDNRGKYTDDPIALGHTRLSVIDTSALAHQPLTDETGRYTITYNGEFYNFRKHREALIQSGVSFRSSSDTVVLLQLYIREGKACLDKINGFFVKNKNH